MTSFSRLSLAAALVGAAILPQAGAQTTTALIREAEALAGAPGFNTTEFSDVSVNHAGGYAVVMTSTMGGSVLHRVWGSANNGAGAILRSEQTGISGFDQSAFETNFGISNSGLVAYSPTVSQIGGGVSGPDAVWVDATPIASQDDPIPALPGFIFDFNSRPGITGNGQVYWVAGIDTAANVDAGEGLFFGAGATPVIKTGDPSPAPLTSTIENVGFDVRYSQLGTHWIMNVNTTDATNADEWLLIDGQIVTIAGGGLVGRGQVIPVAAGGDGVTQFNPAFRSLDINESGEYMFACNTNNAGLDYVFIHNGVIRWRENQVIDGMTVINDPHGNMNEAGDIALIWDTTPGTVETIFLNGEVVIKEGDPIDWDGDSIAETTLLDITSSIGKLLGERNPDGSVDIYFLGTTAAASTREGFFRVHVPSPHPAYCFGDGTGTFCPCSPAPVPHGAPGRGCPTNVFAGGALASATGTASLSADTLVLTGTEMINGSMIFYQGATQQSGGVGAVFGDGLRCIQPTGIRRFKVKPVVGNTATYPEVGDNPISVAGAIAAPGTFHYQGWYRSANPTFCTAATFNLTNGISVSWQP